MSFSLIPEGLAMEPSIRRIDWQEFERLTDIVVAQIRNSREDFDILLGIARGGMSLALMLAQVLPHGMILSCHLRRYRTSATNSQNLPRIVSFPEAQLLKHRRVLLVDEVWDEGYSIIRARQEVDRAEPHLVRTAVVHFKPQNNVFGIARPDYLAEETAEWIEYPWETFAQRHGEPEFVPA